MPSPRIYQLSESSISIEFGNEIRSDIHSQVIACREAILSNPFHGLVEVVTAYSTVTVFYDPLKILGTSPSSTVKEFLENTIKPGVVSGSGDPKAVISIPVCYDKDFAPDLEWVAHLHQTNEEAIINEHCHHNYKVFMIGFMPGFPYMGVLPPSLESPRKQTPRTHVPAGSVGIAGKQTGIYPFDSPGGWQIIGRTPVKLFSPTEQNRSLLHAGDTVRFKPISIHEFNRMISG